MEYCSNDSRALLLELVHCISTKLRERGSRALDQCYQKPCLDVNPAKTAFL